MPPDIVERMKEALRPFAACAKGMTLSDTTHTSTLPADYFRRARAVLAKAENLGKPVLYPAVASKRRMARTRGLSRHPRSRPAGGASVMKLHAHPISYSSVVGGGLTLLNEQGHAAFIIMIRGTSWGISKEQDAAITKQITDYINEHGLEVPDFNQTTARCETHGHIFGLNDRCIFCGQPRSPCGG
jgi:hypothetical protein